METLENRFKEAKELCDDEEYDKAIPLLMRAMLRRSIILAFVIMKAKA